MFSSVSFRASSVVVLINLASLLVLVAETSYTKSPIYREGGALKYCGAQTVSVTTATKVL